VNQDVPAAPYQRPGPKLEAGRTCIHDDHGSGVGIQGLVLMRLGTPM
jgi:hypothetical protein